MRRERNTMQVNSKWLKHLGTKTQWMMMRTTDPIKFEANNNLFISLTNLFFIVTPLTVSFKNIFYGFT